MWVSNVLLVGVLWLIIVLPLVIVIVMPNNLAFIPIRIRGTSWIKIFDSPAVENCTPLSYRPPTPEGVAAALNLLAGRLELRAMFQSMPTEDLRQLMLIQRAIVHVLRLVEGTASDVLRIFVDREAEENFDFDGNLDS